MNDRVLRSAALAALIGLAACSAGQTSAGSVSLVPSAASSSSRHAQDGFGHPDLSMDVALYDAPLPMHGDAHVNLAIAGMDAVSAAGLVPLAAYATPRTVDLLSLQHDALIIAGAVPAGSYDAIRLWVDTSASNVTVDGRTYPMVFHRHGKAAQPAIIGLDAVVAVTGAAGETVSIAVDFNVLESISLRGGSAYVKPKLVVAHHPARIAGHVANATGAPVENATVIAYDASGKVANTTVSGSDGSFTLHALPAGSYRVAVLNTYVTQTREAVTAQGADAIDGPTVGAVVASGDLLDLGTLSD